LIARAIEDLFLKSEKAASGSRGESLSQPIIASPSPTAAVPQGKAEPGGISESKKVPPRAARTDSDATVAPAQPSG